MPTAKKKKAKKGAKGKKGDKSSQGEGQDSALKQYDQLSIGNESASVAGGVSVGAASATNQKESKKDKTLREKAEKEAEKRKIKEEVERIRLEEEERKESEERQRLAEEEAKRLEEEARLKKEERLAHVAVKLAPIRQQRGEVDQLLLSLIEPLASGCIARQAQAILDGHLSLVEEPTSETKLEYFKLLKAQRIAKLKAQMLVLRAQLLKKDFDQRTQEIQALERGDLDPTAWRISYKKLKVKIRGEKVVEPPKKQIKYHYSSGSEEESKSAVYDDAPTPRTTNIQPASAMIRIENSVVDSGRKGSIESGFPEFRAPQTPSNNIDNPSDKQRSGSQMQIFEQTQLVEPVDKDAIDAVISDAKSVQEGGTSLMLISEQRLEKVASSNHGVSVHDQGVVSVQQRSRQATTPMKSSTGGNQLSRLQSPLIQKSSAKQRHYRSPMVRGGSLQSPSNTKDPVKQLIKKLHSEKRERQKNQRERQVSIIREMDARQEEETKKFDEMRKRLYDEKIQRIQDKQQKQEVDRLDRLKFREENAKNYRQVRKVQPLYLEREQKFAQEQTMGYQEAVQQVTKKERVDSEQIKRHKEVFDQIRVQKFEQATKDRQEQLDQQRDLHRAEKQKLSELKTHFADRVAEEQFILKHKLRDDKESKIASYAKRIDYGTSVKKPKIDESLRDKLVNEIKNPSTFLGRQSAHAEVSSLKNNAAVPRSAFLSAATTPFPEVNVSAFGTGRNSIQSQIGLDNSLSIKKDRDYIRKIIKESNEKQTLSKGKDSPESDSKLKWNKQENRFTSRPDMREGPSKDHAAAKGYLETQRGKPKNKLQNAYTRRMSEGLRLNSDMSAYFDENGAHSPNSSYHHGGSFGTQQQYDSRLLASQKYANYDISEQHSIAERMSTEGQQAAHQKGGDFPYVASKDPAGLDGHFNNNRSSGLGEGDSNNLSPDVRLSELRQSFGAKEKAGQYNTSFNIPTTVEHSQSQLNDVNKTAQEYGIGYAETLNDRDDAFQVDLSPNAAVTQQSNEI